MKATSVIRVLFVLLILIAFGRHDCDASDRVAGPQAGPAPSQTTRGAPEDGSSETSSFDRHKESDFRLVLSSGRTIDVGEIFTKQGREFERLLNKTLQLKNPTLLRINHSGSQKPQLVASRRGKVLHGPFASLAEDGSPIAYMTYNRGDRDSTLFTWDEVGRPLVFAEYRDGEIDGLRCLFRGCCEDCTSGHIWLVEQWDQGELLAAHVVPPDGTPISVSYRYRHPNTEVRALIDAATTELASFETKLNGDEQKLKQMVAIHYSQQRAASAERIQLAAARHRYRLMSASQFSSPNFAMMPVSGASGFS